MTGGTPKSVRSDNVQREGSEIDNGDESDWSTKDVPRSSLVDFDN